MLAYVHGERGALCRYQSYQSIISDYQQSACMAISVTLHEHSVVCLVMGVDIPQCVAEFFVTMALDNRCFVTDIVCNPWLSSLPICCHFILDISAVCPVQHITICTQHQHPQLTPIMPTVPYRNTVRF